MTQLGQMTGHSAGPPLDSTARLCHDVKQYVAAGMMLAEEPGDAAIDAHLVRRFESIHSALQSAMDLLATAGGTPHDAGLVDLAELVEECKQTVRVTRPVHLIVHTPTPALVCGDTVALRRALMNIIDNAARAAGARGTVVVRVEQCDGRSCVEVTDDGPGFGRIALGTGLGLTSLGEATHECHGRLEISSGPGPGTTVRLTVPTGAWDAS